MEKTRAVERSVQSLQRIYAFVVALAIGRAIESTFVTEEVLSFHPDRLPIFLAFLVTVVPFFHGMNRHLDRCYLEQRDSNVQKALLFDFIVFFIEAGLLFAFAASTQSGLSGFLILAVMLALDIPWAMISQWIHYGENPTGTWLWATVNTGAIVLIVAIYFLDVYAPLVKPWILAMVAAVRSGADYWLSWDLYFPPIST
jgi:hypothetical protein